ncbi:MAG: hypothetical protein AB8B55_00070 [Mariniblastus sp.]
MSKIVILLHQSTFYLDIVANLEKFDHEIRIAGTAEDAIDLARLFEPDLLIIDSSPSREGLNGEDSSCYTSIEVIEAFEFANRNRTNGISKTLLISNKPKSSMISSISYKGECLESFACSSKVLYRPSSAEEIITAANAMLSKQTPLTPSFAKAPFRVSMN